MYILDNNTSLRAPVWHVTSFQRCVLFGIKCLTTFLRFCTAVSSTKNNDFFTFFLNHRLAVTILTSKIQLFIDSIIVELKPYLQGLFNPVDAFAMHTYDTQFGKRSATCASNPHASPRHWDIEKKFNAYIAIFSRYDVSSSAAPSSAQQSAAIRRGTPRLRILQTYRQHISDISNMFVSTSAM